MRFLNQQAAATQQLSLALTPLVDIIFLLIIFFLLSSTFQTKEKELGIQLPETKGTQSQEQPFTDYFFNIKPDGSIIINGRIHSLPEVEIFLKETLPEREHCNMIMRADKSSRYETIGKLLGLLSEYNYKRISFVTLDEKG
ncbi:MAG: biopolymer transporter ExbD [Planctomycetes bacterium]|nr:biopolymer transporter ExbD [Planctomycetota bacterium]